MLIGCLLLSRFLFGSILSDLECPDVGNDGRKIPLALPVVLYTWLLGFGVPRNSCAFIQFGLHESKVQCVELLKGKWKSKDQAMHHGAVKLGRETAKVSECLIEPHRWYVDACVELCAKEPYTDQ